MAVPAAKFMFKSFKTRRILLSLEIVACTVLDVVVPVNSMDSDFGTSVFCPLKSTVNLSDALSVTATLEIETSKETAAAKAAKSNHIFYTKIESMWPDKHLILDGCLRGWLYAGALGTVCDDNLAYH